MGCRYSDVRGYRGRSVLVGCRYSDVRGTAVRGVTEDCMYSDVRRYSGEEGHGGM